MYLSFISHRDKGVKRNFISHRDWGVKGVLFHTELRGVKRDFVY
jgi:hypothetical protein